ncbi:MAG: hypothetical protein WC254_06375 [Candidatus Woesearchaeota archaeon]|jgi:hypothetical protein
MKKISNLFFISVLFISVLFIYLFKVEASAVTVSVTAKPTTINKGGSSTITWSSSGATSCTYNGSPVALSSSTGFEVTPDTTTTYTIRCTNGMVYYQLSPCNYANVAAEYYASAGSWQTGTLVQGASGVYYIISGSNDSDNPSKTNVAGITSKNDPSLCK